MDDGTPTLEVGFAIDTGGSFAELLQLQRAMDSVEGKMVASAAGIERATGGMLNLGGATADMRSFGSAATRELENIRRAKNSVEKDGERMIRQLDREAAALGKTREQVREAKIETLALSAAQQGNTDLADRLFASSRRVAQGTKALAETQAEATARAVAATNAEAQALRDAAFAHQMFEARVRQGVAAMRDEEAAVRAAAAAKADLEARARRLIAAVDPAAAAQDRFNTEMAEARALTSAGAISLDQYVAKLGMETNTLNAATAAKERNAAAATRNRMALQGASYQVQDFMTQVSMGTNPINAFAVQGAQLAGQFSEVEGKAGNVARFFMGPWGLAITGGLLVLAPFVDMLLKNNKALDDAVNKLKKDAEETVANGRAKEKFAATQEGVTAAIRDQVEALRASQISERESLELAVKGAAQRADTVLKIREETVALLDRAKAQLAIDQADTKSPDFNRQFRIQNLKEAIPDIEKRLGKAKSEAITAQEAVDRANLALGRYRAEALVDPIAKINDQAAAEITAAEKKAVAAHMSADAIAVEIAAIKRRQAAAIEAHREVERAAAGTNQMGRNIDLVEARKIAQSVGGRVTSDLRSRAEQERLYAKYVSYKSGKGPWAALAAKPGTSSHELGQAIDVAKGDGVTLKKLVAAYRAAGVKLTETLDEGSHYHIAWKKTGAAAKEDSEAARAAAEQKRKYEAAVEATDSYIAAQAKAGAQSGKTAKEIRLMEDAVERLKAPTEAQKVALDQAAAAREAAFGKQAAAEFDANVMQPLRDELAMYDLIGPARAEAALLGEKQAFLAKNMDQGIETATARWEEYYGIRKKILDAGEKAQFDETMKPGEARLSELREELRLVGATDAERVRALATFKATQEAEATLNDPARRAAYVAQQVQIADETERLAAAQRDYNDALMFAADRWDLIAGNIQRAGQGLGEAFGKAGGAVGELATLYTSFHADRERLDAAHQARLAEIGDNQRAMAREQQLYALKTATAQIGLYGDMATAAKGFFKEGSDGYKAMAAAEKVFRAVEFAMSVRAIAQDAIETGQKLASSAARTAAHAVEAVTKAIASLPFPANLAAGAATVAALAAIGVTIAGGFGGGGKTPKETNTGTGTVFGDPKAQSESVKNAIDALKEVDTLTNTYAREMASSLRSIENQIGGLASLVVRAGDIGANAGVTEGFKKNLVGSVLSVSPLLGGLIGNLFGTTTKVIGSGLSAGPQSLGGILGGGFDASYYSDIEKKKKLFGLTTSTKTSTQYQAADGALETQFGLLLRSFNDAIVAAAGPLGAATGDIQSRLNGFVVDLGKIDLKGLTGTEIQEKLAAVFGAAADGMATAAFPMIAQFQKVGEGAFETLVRVASTVEAVTVTLDQLGMGARALGLDAKMGLAAQFESVGALTDVAQAYFSDYYSEAEQDAARAAQLGKVFDSLGLAMPATLAGFRGLVEAQDLTTASGQAAYATLLQLAPAFAELQEAMAGAKSVADILTERTGLERTLLELQGDTAAIRALDLLKLDASNRGLQQQVWAMQDAQEAAKAAEALREAWTSVGDTIMDEVRRIRGLTDATGGGSFQSLMGQFNAATAAARGGDLDAAKSLPQLSQALLAAAADAARSRQELDRVQAQTAASLEATLGLVAGLGNAPASNAALLDAGATSQPSSAAANDNSDGLRAALDEVRGELVQMRADLNVANATIAGNTGRIARKLDDVTNQSGGDAIATVAAA
ncbi:MAG TPA: D-alanyl-D-alanine carboxypeptidase family protein [Allosphingosinicella sp.]|jgi:hypothetical protein